MEDKIKLFQETLQVLHDKGILPHLILIGSWAEYIYETVLYDGYISYLKTQDMDFLVPNIARPTEKINLSEILADCGFIYDEERFSGVAKFYKNGLLELEFLATVKGSGEKTVYEIPSLGIKAEGLRYLDLLSEFSVTVNARGIPVRVPLPQAYLLHKLLINDQRKGFKKEKDLQAVRNLLLYLKDYPEQLKVLQEIYEHKLSKKQRGKIEQNCSTAMIVLF